MTPLSRKALTGLVKFQAALALLLFLPAWSIRYWEAWAYWSVFTVSVSAITAYFLERDPAFIERRLDVGPAAERERSQKIIQTVASVLTCMLFIIPGLDHAFGWSMPLETTWKLAADCAVATGFLLMFLAFRANSYASAIVEVEAGQRVVSTGPYRWVRHPMYTGTVLMYLATPLALGSFWGLLPAAALTVVIAVRLHDEEHYLVEHLPGYGTYRETVRSRLLPGIW